MGKVADNVFYSAISALKQTKKLSNKPEFLRVVQSVALASWKKQRIWTSGMGKAGLVAHKLASTLSSNNIPAAYIHSGEALHGDFGAIQKNDILIAFSNSGKTDEVSLVADKAKSTEALLILITGDNESKIARKADIVLCYGKLQESCPLGLTPTTSISVMLVVADAIAMEVQAANGLTYEQYSRNHHAGYLGQISLEKARRKK